MNQYLKHFNIDLLTYCNGGKIILDFFQIFQNYGEVSAVDIDDFSLNI